MTRGRMVVITNDGVYTSIEFNGDMYPQGNGRHAISTLIDIHNVSEFKNAVNQFNRELYGYGVNECTFDLGNDIEDLFYMNNFVYFYKWGSDYLYVKNATDKQVQWKDREGNSQVMEPDSITIMYGGDKRCMSSYGL